MRVTSKYCNKLFSGDLFYKEVNDIIEITYVINGRKCVARGENCFDTLTKLRSELEKDNITLLCNGAAINVYPSGMMRDVSTCELAYKMEIGKPAKWDDVVNIFEYDPSLRIATVSEQKQYYSEWLTSLGCDNAR